MKLTINIPEGCEQYADDIRRFVDAMVYKLDVHKNKGRWENLTVAQSIDLLRKEVIELDSAIIGGNMIEIILEAADVANFALICSSVAIARGTNEDA